MARVVPSRIVSVIETAYPWAAEAADGKKGAPALAPDQAPAMGMIITLIEDVPAELLPEDADDYALLLAATGAMRAALRNWQSGGHPGHATSLHPMTALGGDSPVTAVLKVLRKCQDEAPAEQIAGLEFIPNSDARRSLRTDASTAHRALGNGEYKAATVLAGSVIEALLLWVITDSNEDARSDAVTAINASWKDANRKALDSRGPEFWHLPDYIEVAAELGIVDDSTRSALRLTAEYRNLIHPGRVLRSGEDCTHGTGLTALGAMERLIEVLEKRAV